jgi:hypothetical protein
MLVLRSTTKHSTLSQKKLSSATERHLLSDAGEEGTRTMLLADHSVDCDSDSYKSMRAYAIIMIVALDGGLSVIALWGLHQLRPTLLAVDCEQMDDHPRLRNSPLRPLFADFMPFAAPYYGVCDMMRRLTLTCVTVMFSDQHATFFIVTLAAAILAVAAQTQLRPHR